MTWSAAALGDLCKIVSGATPKTGEARFWGGEVPWATPKDLSSLDTEFLDWPERSITQEGLRSCAASILPHNSVLLSSRAPIGLVAINTRPMATNQGFKSLVPDSRKLNSKFLFHWLKANKNHLQSLGNGATFKEISKAVVERIEIPLPPLDEQRRIAAILDKADALRRKRKRALDLLDGLTQSVFLEMFGDPVANELGHATAKLGSLGNWRSGGTPSRAHKEYFSGKIPWFTSGELNDMYVLRSIENISEQALLETSAKEVEPGAIMLGMYDTAAFKSSIASDRCSCNQAIAFALLDESIVETAYVYVAIQIAKERLKQMQRGVRQKNLNISIVKNIDIPIPTINSQRKFAQFVVNVRYHRDKTLEGEIIMKKTFDSLQSRAFSGQL